MARILSLDNDQETLDLLVRFLRSVGYDAHGTTSEHQALHLLRTQKFDVFTQDLARPLMPGEELIRFIKDDENLFYIPVILITGYSKKDSAEFLRSFDLNLYDCIEGFLLKPFNAKGLFNMVATVLEKYEKPLPIREANRRAQERSRRLI